MNQYQYEVGDIVKLKKPHPCGSHEWEILRVGADFRLKFFCYKGLRALIFVNSIISFLSSSDILLK